MTHYSWFSTVNELIFFRYTYPRSNIAAIVDGFSIDETKNKKEIMISIDLPSTDSQEQLINYLGAILPPDLIMKAVFCPNIRIDINKQNQKLIIKVLLIINQLAPFDTELIQNLEQILTLNGALTQSIDQDQYVLINEPLAPSSLG